MRQAGYEEETYRDRGIEFVLRKTSDEPFKVPVETGTSVTVDNDVWERSTGGAPVIVTPILMGADALNGMSARQLGRAFISRVGRGISNRLGRS